MVVGSHRVVEVHRQFRHEVKYRRRVYRGTERLVGGGVNFCGWQAAEVAETVAHAAPDRDHQFDVANAIFEADQVRAARGQLFQ